MSLGLGCCSCAGFISVVDEYACTDDVHFKEIMVDRSSKNQEFIAHLSAQSTHEARRSHSGKDESANNIGCVIRAMQVVSQEQAAAAAAASLRREAQKQRQVTQVLEASKMRSDRAARVAKLKVGLTQDLGGCNHFLSAILASSNAILTVLQLTRHLLSSKPGICYAVQHSAVWHVPNCLVCGPTYCVTVSTMCTVTVTVIATACS